MNILLTYNFTLSCDTRTLINWFFLNFRMVQIPLFVHLFKMEPLLLVIMLWRDIKHLLKLRRLAKDWYIWTPFLQPPLGRDKSVDISGHHEGFSWVNFSENVARQDQEKLSTLYNLIGWQYFVSSYIEPILSFFLFSMVSTLA